MMLFKYFEKGYVSIYILSTDYTKITRKRLMILVIV